MRATVLILCLALLVGCVRSPDNRPDPGNRNENAKDGRNTLPRSDLEKEIAAMKPIDPVDFEKLMPFLPKAPPGYDVEEPEGQSLMLDDRKYTMAERIYRHDGNTLTATIHDYACVAPLYTSFALYANLDIDLGKEYQKGVTIDDNKGWETYHKGSKKGELMMMVGKRYIVHLRANGVPADFLRGVFTNMDIKGLAALK